MANETRMNVTLNTTSTEELSSDLVLILILITKCGYGITGCLAILLNITILFYICRIQRDRPNSFNIQVLFVSAVDGLAGLSIFLEQVLTVTEYGDAVFCGVVYLVDIATQLVSKGNIFCICLQRYIFTRSLKKIVPVWGKRHTATIAVVNVVIGVICAAFLRMNYVVATPPYANHQCIFTVVYTSPSGYNRVAVLMMVVAIFTVLLSDIVCLLTMCKLRSSSSNRNAVAPSSNPSRQSNSQRAPHAHNSRSTDDWPSNTSTSSALLKIAQKRNHHAIVTVALILISFTLSYVPAIGVLAGNVIGNPLPLHQQRVFFVLNHFPCFVNPLLIATRTQELRRRLREDLATLRSRFIT